MEFEKDGANLGGPLALKIDLIISDKIYLIFIIKILISIYFYIFFYNEKKREIMS